MLFLTYWFVLFTAVVFPLYWFIRYPPIRMALMCVCCAVFHTHFAGPAGVLGQHTIVALIDTGVQAVSPTLTTTVIGGENLVPLTVDPVASATSRLNDWHGTAVADMIAD